MNRPGYVGTIGDSAMTSATMFGSNLIMCRGPLSKAEKVPGRGEAPGRPR
jgi:hypothetical protein